MRVLGFLCAVGVFFSLLAAWFGPAMLKVSIETSLDSALRSVLEPDQFESVAAREEFQKVSLERFEAAIRFSLSASMFAGMAAALGLMVQFFGFREKGTRFRFLGGFSCLFVSAFLVVSSLFAPTVTGGYAIRFGLLIARSEPDWTLAEQKAKAERIQTGVGSQVRAMLGSFSFHCVFLALSLGLLSREAFRREDLKGVHSTLAEKGDS